MNQNFKQTKLIIFLCITIFAFFGIAYAAFTKNISISGTGTVNKTSWKIVFKDLETPPVLTGDAEQVSTPTIKQNGTELSDYRVYFYKNNDSITYTFKVANDGNFDAKLTSINIPTPTCTKTLAGVNSDATTTCSNLTYTLKYDDGTNLQLNDTLDAGTYRTLKLKLEYTSTSQPTADVEISNLGISLTYTQV